MMLLEQIFTAHMPLLLLLLLLQNAAGALYTVNKPPEYNI